jgi:hypothetical protein
MADNGISKVMSGTVASLPGQRSVESAQQRASRSVAAAGQGGVGREAPAAGRRQWVNMDGKVLDRAAPRGTYLNIVV